MPESKKSAVLHRDILPVVLSALGITLAALVASDQLQALDKEIFERLLLAFGEEESLISAITAGQSINAWTTAAGVLNICGFFVFGAGATYISLKLPVVPRTLSTVSLFVLTLLFQWNLAHLFKMQTHPVGFLTALTLGWLAGYYLRSREERRKENESHYYELKLRNQELLDTRLTLLKQDEIERRILAADLHDQVLNDLKQVVQKFETYVKEPDDKTADSIRSLTDQVMREIREVMDSLSPSVLEHLGLAAAIEDCLRRGGERSGFKVRFRSKIDGDELSCLSMVEQGLLYRLVQESVTNICKHAAAATVRATMEREEDLLLIKVSDDGKGLDPAKARSDSRGLKYMRYRADLIGATIGWKPGEDARGTTVEIRIPLKVEPGDDRAVGNTESGAVGAGQP